MNIRKYIAFLQTVEVGNVTQSAQALGYTQSAVSKMISDLEAEWNTKLLIRGYNGVQLTSDGLTLLPLIQAVVRDYNNLNFMVSEIHHVQAGLIRVGSFPSFSSGLLPLILKSFHEKYPNISIQLSCGEYGDISDSLHRGMLDCAFLAMPTAGDLEVDFLMEDALVAILPPGHPLAAAEIYPLEMLPQENLIRLKETQDYEINRFLDNLPFPLHTAYEIQSDFALLAMVESGLGISIVHDLMLRPSRYNLVRLPLSRTEYRRICIARKRDADLSNITKLFIEHVLSFREKKEFFMPD